MVQGYGKTWHAACTSGRKYISRIRIASRRVRLEKMKTKTAKAANEGDERGPLG